jgi:hypothetical protein
LAYLVFVIFWREVQQNPSLHWIGAAERRWYSRVRWLAPTSELNSLSGGRRHAVES